MFADTLTLDYKGTDDLVLVKRKESNYSSEYFGSVGLDDVVMTIKHTIPATRLGGEHSHMVRFDITRYDAANAIVARFSTWRVLASYLGQQDSVTLADIYDSSSEFLNPGNITKILNGES